MSSSSVRPSLEAYKDHQDLADVATDASSEMSKSSRAAASLPLTLMQMHLLLVLWCYWWDVNVQSSMYSSLRLHMKSSLTHIMSWCLISCRGAARPTRRLLYIVVLVGSVSPENLQSGKRSVVTFRERSRGAVIRLRDWLAYLRLGRMVQCRKDAKKARSLSLASEGSGEPPKVHMPDWPALTVERGAIDSCKARNTS